MNFLLEIGCEEIPDWMLAGALEHLGSSIGALLAEHKLGGGTVRTDATPRRLVVRVSDVIPQQPDSEERVWGPPASAPQAAVAGFAKKQAVDPAHLEILSDGKAEKYSYLRRVTGRSASAILADLVPQIVLRTPFPKTMYWAAANANGKAPVRFIRPIRWIVALLDDEIVPFEIAGIASGNHSSGHRKLGAARFPVTCENFEQQLRENFVILSADERRARIQAIRTRYVCDNGLLNTLVNLTEWPTPIAGSFDPEFLDLPKEVLTTVMRHHQKYFSVESSAGDLAPEFVAVTNTDGDPDGLIRQGNERVLRARFNDARFFWDADQKRRLADRVQDLANVTFQAKLGTYLEKTERVASLVAELSRMAKLPEGPEVRAAYLAKADLTTELVKEFTELQGVIGGLYARAQGEPEEVALAIYDHYKPESMDDSIPRTRAGQLLSLADKLDTLRGCFGVGLIPSGSKDPFALRRAAQGVVRILVEARLRLPLQTLCGRDAALEEFMADRVRYYFRDIRGFRYDEVNAVMASGWDDLVDCEERLEALRGVRTSADFEPLAASFKRIRNILKQAKFEGVEKPLAPELLEAGPETQLFERFMVVSEALRIVQDYRGRLEQIASLRPQLDTFFDKILVNAPDPVVRQNRLTLLHAMLAEFSTIADFSEIVTNSPEVKGTNS